MGQTPTIGLLTAASSPSKVGLHLAGLPVDRLCRVAIQAWPPDNLADRFGAPSLRLDREQVVTSMQTSAPPAASQSTLDLSRIAQDLQIRKVHVENVLHMLDDGFSVPFMARFRKERTGGLGEEVIRRIQFRIGLLRHLGERKQTVLKTIENQGKLTDELKVAILAAESPKRLEDLYLPYKPKKRTQASEAREQGLEPLAQAIWQRDPVAANLPEVLQALVNPEKKLTTADEVLAGVKYILAEIISEQAELRGAIRFALWESGQLVSVRNEALPENRGQEFKGYFEFKESAQHVPPHRILAINRGEKEDALKVRIDYDAESIRRAAITAVPLDGHPHGELLHTALEDAVVRIVLPSLEREVRRELTDFAQDHAVSIFARNLRSLLLQRPLRDRRILGIDPGLRSGCRLAAIDEHGNLLEHALVFPNQPFHKKQDARIKIEELLRKHHLSVVAIGNGTGCRDTEKLIAELIADLAAGKSSQITAEPVAETAPATPTESTEPTAASASPEPVVAEPPVTEPPVAAPVSAEEPVVLPVIDAASTAPPSAEPVIPSPAEPPPIAAPETAAPAAEAPPAVPVVHRPAPPKIPEPPPQPPIDLSALPPAPPDISYVIVNEAGASDYSTSQVAREEFPDFDNSLRGTISIGRRLQDPLCELVKIDPQHVGVGLYQHDVRPRHLRESLEAVVESCVNHVGADVNTASIALLRFVSGLNTLVAREIVEYRKQHGPFQSREQLKQVASLNDKRFEQAAGFLKVSGGADPLDETWIHPENYSVAHAVLADVGMTAAELRSSEKLAELREKLKSVHPEVYAAKTGLSLPAIKEVFELLANPTHDPRADLPPPIFRKNILKIEDLQPNMELKGTVLNVVDFGAFVDIGLKDSGLVHISQLANRFIKNPYEVISVGDVVTVWVRTVDAERRHVSLSMIAPGSERKPPERRPGPPPRGERREGPPAQAHQGQPGQGASGPQGPDRGQRRGRPPRRDFRRPGGPPAPADAPAASAAPAPPPQRPYRPPGKPKPLPKLSQSALKGKTPLHSFGELEAFFRAKDEPAPAPPPASPPAPETPPPSTE